MLEGFWAIFRKVRTSGSMSRVEPAALRDATIGRSVRHRPGRSLLIRIVLSQYTIRAGTAAARWKVWDARNIHYNIGVHSN
jgi:hypothetical protein